MTGSEEEDYAAGAGGLGLGHARAGSANDDDNYDDDENNGILNFRSMQVGTPPRSLSLQGIVVDEIDHGGAFDYSNSSSGHDAGGGGGGGGEGGGKGGPAAQQVQSVFMSGGFGRSRSRSGSDVSVEVDGAHYPAECFCPITSELMVDPVTASDGHSYERSAITQWLAHRNMSPKTGLALASTALVPNHNLRNVIETLRGGEGGEGGGGGGGGGGTTA